MADTTDFSDTYVVNSTWLPEAEVNGEPIVPLGALSGDGASFSHPAILMKSDGTIVYMWTKHVGSGSYELKVGYCPDIDAFRTGEEVWSEEEDNYVPSVTEDHVLVATREDSHIAPYFSVTEIDGSWYMVLCPGTTETRGSSPDPSLTSSYPAFINNPDSATPAASLIFDARMEEPDWDNPTPTSYLSRTDRGPFVYFVADEGSSDGSGTWLAYYFYPNEFVYRSDDEGETWVVDHLLARTKRLQTLPFDNYGDITDVYNYVVDPTDGFFEDQREIAAGASVTHNYVWDEMPFATNGNNHQPSPIVVDSHGYWNALLPIRSLPYVLGEACDDSGDIVAQDRRAGYGEFFGRSTYVLARGYGALVIDCSDGGPEHGREMFVEEFKFDLTAGGCPVDPNKLMPYRHLQDFSPSLFTWVNQASSPSEYLGWFGALDSSASGLLAFIAGAVFDDDKIYLYAGGGDYRTQFDGVYPAGSKGAGFADSQHVYLLTTVSSSLRHIIRIPIDEFPLENPAGAELTPVDPYTQAEFLADVDVVVDYTNNDGFGGTEAYNNSDNMALRAGNYVFFTNGNSIYSAELARVSGYVFNDVAGDGVYAGSEDPISAVVIYVYSEAVLVGSTTSDANGYYEFPVVAGDYELEVELPSASTGSYILTTEDLTFTANGTDQVTPVNIGLQQPARVAGVVYVDDDEDGVVDPGESVYEVAGVNVRLYNVLTSELISTTPTESDGTFEVSDVPPGVSVRLTLTPPTGYEVTNAYVHSFDSGDDVVYNLGIREIRFTEPGEDAGWGFIPFA